MVILGGFVAGIIVATSDFYDPRILYNGWIRLAVVGAAMLVLFWAVLSLQGRMLRRLQLCIILSLLLHVGLALYLNERYLLFSSPQAEEIPSEVVEDLDRTTLPEYSWHQMEQPDATESFAEPVEVTVPDQADDVPARKIAQHATPPAQQELPDRQQPNPVDLQRAESPSTPKRADALSKTPIDRRQFDPHPGPQEPVDQPQVQAHATAAPPPLRSQQAEALRRHDAPAAKPAASEPALAQSQRVEQRIERAAEPQSLPVAETSRSRLQKTTDTARLPRLQSQVPEPSALAEQAPQNQLEARDASTNWRATTAVLPRAEPADMVGSPTDASVPLATTVPGRIRRSNDATPVLAAASPQRAGRQAAPLPAALPGTVATTDNISVGSPSSGSATTPEAPVLLAADARASVARRRGADLPTAVPGEPGGFAGGDSAPLVAPSGWSDTPGRPAAAPSAATLSDSGAPARADMAPSAGALTAGAHVDVPSTSPGDSPSPSTTASDAFLRGTAASGIAASEPDVGHLRRQTDGPSMAVATLAGPNGPDAGPSIPLGIPDRRARPESEQLQPTTHRFLVERSGGAAAMQGRLREMSKEAFRQRDPTTRGRIAQARGGSVETERAVELGLDYLARHQFADGHWSIDRFPNGAVDLKAGAAGEMNADTAGTGLALLAFLGAGYTHRNDKYRTVVRGGIDWLTANQQANGQLFTERTDQAQYGQAYGQGIATIALCEAYGMTKDPHLRSSAQKAVQFILNAQHPTRGGWRYRPRIESDTSVSGWQLMALRSAQMAGLEVPADNLLKVGHWLDLAQAAEGSRYRYNPYAADTPEQREGRNPNRTMTAEGLLMRMYLGWQRDHTALIEGAEFLKANLPENGQPGQWRRDAYYWYYATQVMFHMQGEYWNAWNDHLRPLLQTSQVQTGPWAGSWDPNEPVPDRWAEAAGRHYVTCLNLLMLEVYYRHLPLYRTLVQ